MALTTTEGDSRETSVDAKAFSAGRRWLARLNLLVATVLAIYILVLFNVIVYRHPVRIDLTEEGLHELSQETRAKLGLVKEEVQIIFAFYQQPRNPQHLAYTRVFQRTLDLLKEINAFQPLVRVELKVNVFQEPDRWTSLCKKYDLTPSQFNRVIFIAGEGGAYKQSLAPNELALLEAGSDPSIAPRIVEFRGEKAVVDTIMKLVQREVKKVYFTTGHREMALEPAAGQPPALGALRSDLASSGYDPESVSVLETKGVPDDCQLLVIAGPDQLFSHLEVQYIETYVAGGGRLLVALGPNRSGLEDFLKRWGVEVLDHRVGTQILQPGRKTEQSWVDVRAFNRGPEITRPFVDMKDNFRMTFFEPRPLRLGSGQPTMRGEILLSTGENTDTVRCYLHGKSSTPQFIGAERNGNFVLAVVLSPTEVQRPPPGWVKRKTRIVVVGATNFLRDHENQLSISYGYLSASHRDFLMNSVHWLTDAPNLMAVGGQKTLRRQLPKMDASKKRFLFIASVVIFPGVFALLGLAAYFLRRT